MIDLENILNKVRIPYIILKAKIIDKYKNVNTKWYKERKKTCDGCILNSKNTNENKNFKYYIFNILNLNQPFCTKCKCEIRAKISVEEENCPENKW